MRFELSIAALNSAIEIIAPWRDDEFTSRFEKKKFSLSRSLNLKHIAATF